MPAIPQREDTTVRRIFDAYQKSIKPRPSIRIGGSAIGKPCLRALWYDFRWATPKSATGSRARRWAQGHNAEALFIKDLESIGAAVYAFDPTTRKQWELNALDGHLVAYPDGFAQNMPEAPKALHVVSFKITSRKYFLQIRKKGLPEVFPAYVAQAMLEMHLSLWKFGNKMGAHRALILIENSDDGELEAYRVKYDKAQAVALMEKAKLVIQLQEPPERIRDDPSYYLCSWCDHKAICHDTAMPLPTCRTCCHSTAVLDGKGDDRRFGRWTCDRYNVDDIRGNEQWQGCADHVYFPSLVSYAEHVDSCGELNCQVYESKETGHNFGNGTRSDDVYSSRELYESPPPEAVFEYQQDIDNAKALRSEFDGSIRKADEKGDENSVDD